MCECGTFRLFNFGEDMFISKKDLGLKNCGELKYVSGIECELKISIVACDLNKSVISGEHILSVSQDFLKNIEKEMVSYIKNDVENLLVGESVKKSLKI